MANFVQPFGPSMVNPNDIEIEVHKSDTFVIVSLDQDLQKDKPNHEQPAGSSLIESKDEKNVRFEIQKYEKSESDIY